MNKSGSEYIKIEELNEVKHVPKTSKNETISQKDTKDEMIVNKNQEAQVNPKGNLPKDNDIASSQKPKSDFFGERDVVVAKGGVQLGKAELKSISSLESQIVKHESKLAEYIKDPMKFDNKGFLKNAPSDAIRQKIIQTRVNHLNQEIQTFQNNIQKILNRQ
jgi:hypothetical protein